LVVPSGKFRGNLINGKIGKSDRRKRNVGKGGKAQ